MSEYETGRCVIGTKPHGAEIGYTCAHHLQRMSTMLREIEDQAAMLSAVPSMQQQTGARGGSLKSHRAPARLEVLVHNDPRHGTGRSEDDDDALAAGETLSILGTLHSWARLVREERDLSRPDQVTVSGERDLLSRSLDWIAAQEWVDEFEHDVRLLVSQLKAQNGTQDDKPVGRCFLTYAGEVCAGPIWVDNAAGHAHCGWCRKTWDGAELHRLNLILEQERAERNRPRTEDGRPMRTASELASDLGISVNAVRLRLSKARLRAVNGSYYDPQWLRRADMAS